MSQINRRIGADAASGGRYGGQCARFGGNENAGHAAIASKLAAEIYGLNVLRENIEDSASNTTRFLIMSATPDDAEPDEENVMTSFIFRVRNVPAALYKALGGFATNKVNMTKLESYQPNGFLATQFYADIEGHPESEPVRQALEELSFTVRNGYFGCLSRRAGARRLQDS